MRVPMVTRTIKATKIHCLCVSLIDKTVSEQDFIISGTYKDEKALNKAVVKHSPAPDDVKIVNVISAETVESLMGMTEADFIAHAKPIIRTPKND